MLSADFDISKIKEKILNVTIVLYAFFLSVIYLAVTLRSLPYGMSNLVITQGILSIGIIILAVFRKKLSANVKIYSIMLIVFIALLSGLLNYGFLGSSKVYILIVPVFVSLIFSYKKALYILIFYIITYAIFGYLYSGGNLQISIDANQYIARSVVWIMEASIIFSTGWALIYVSNYLDKTITSNYNTIQEQNVSLKKEEEKYHAQYNYNPLPTFTLRKQNEEIIVIDLNWASTEYPHIDTNNIIGKNIFSAFNIGPHSPVKEMIQTVLDQKENKNLELKHQFASNEKYRYINFVIGFIPNNNVLLAINDITEKKRTEEKLVFAMINAEERERSRVAKELHDGVSPVLSATKLYLQSLINATEETKKNEISIKIFDAMNESIRSISEISNKLSPHVLTNFGLATAIQSFIDKVKDTCRLSFDYSYNIKKKINPQIETNLYRVAVELINNTIKYGQAKNIFINIKEKNNYIDFYFEHDGKGFDLEKVKKDGRGMGLHNLNNRIKVLNGQIQYITSPDAGVKVIIKAPMQIE